MRHLTVFMILFFFVSGDALASIPALQSSATPGVPSSDDTTHMGNDIAGPVDSAARSGQSAVLPASARTKGLPSLVSPQLFQRTPGHQIIPLPFRLALTWRKTRGLPQSSLHFLHIPYMYRQWSVIS